MEYENFDSSGTDDDLPPSHQNIPRRACFVGIERAPIDSVPYSRMQSEMEALIHQLEREAYSSMLRAFIAQSDALTWEKEGLITELRKELRVSDDEHRELLPQVNADDVIQRIREWRQGGRHQSTLLSTSQSVRGTISPPAVSAYRKRQKTSNSVPSVPLSVLSSGLHHQSGDASLQPSYSTGVRRTTSGTKGKRPKPYRSGPTGRGQYFQRGFSGALAANAPTEATASDPLIGRIVKTRWPEDRNFYKAVIMQYNPLEGRHALVYDKGTTNESWEWVNLKEIPPEDIRWEGEDPGISRTRGRGARGRGRMKFSNRGGGSLPGAGSGRGSSIGEFRSELPAPQTGNVKKVPDEIEILHTDTLIAEVERIVGADNPDLAEIERAKARLKAHEQTLVDLISRLAYVSDGESDEEQPRSNPQSRDIERELRSARQDGDQQPTDRERELRSANQDGDQRGANSEADMLRRAAGQGDGNQPASNNQEDDDDDDVIVDI